jgi:hypothetical protein
MDAVALHTLNKWMAHLKNVLPSAQPWHRAVVSSEYFTRKGSTNAIWTMMAPTFRGGNMV